MLACRHESREYRKNYAIITLTKEHYITQYLLYNFFCSFFWLCKETPNASRIPCISTRSASFNPEGSSHGGRLTPKVQHKETRLCPIPNLSGCMARPVRWPVADTVFVLLVFSIPASAEIGYGASAPVDSEFLRALSLTH